MFKNRKITVTVDKKNKEETPDTPEDLELFEHHADVVLRRLERIGTKVMIGICAFVVLDTIRQIAVAQNTYYPDQD